MTIYVAGISRSFSNFALSARVGAVGGSALFALASSIPSAFAASPIVSYQEEENAAIGAFLKARLSVEKEIPFCLNATLKGITAEQLKLIKGQALEASPNPEGRAFSRDLKALSYSMQYQETRIVQFTNDEEKRFNIRPSSLDECRNHVTYRLNRVMIRKKAALITGVNARFGETVMFAINLMKYSDTWKSDFFRQYDFFSGPPSSAQFRRVLPGAVGDKFYIIGEIK